VNVFLRSNKGLRDCADFVVGFLTQLFDVFGERGKARLYLAAKQSELFKGEILRFLGHCGTVPRKVLRTI
jgi:hypothetical protein